MRLLRILALAVLVLAPLGSSQAAPKTAGHRLATKRLSAHRVRLWICTRQGARLPGHLDAGEVDGTWWSRDRRALAVAETPAAFLKYGVRARHRVVGLAVWSRSLGWRRVRTPRLYRRLEWVKDAFWSSDHRRLLVRAARIQGDVAMGVGGLWCVDPWTDRCQALAAEGMVTQAEWISRRDVRYWSLKPSKKGWYELPRRVRVR